jgi:hypothetical protein
LGDQHLGGELLHVTEPHVGTHLFRALGDRLGEGMHVAGRAVIDDEHPRHAIKRVAHRHDPRLIGQLGGGQLEPTAVAIVI